MWAERQPLNHTHTTPLKRETHRVVRSLMHILTHSKLICPKTVQTGQRSDRVNQQQAEFSPSCAHQDLSTCLRGAPSEIAVSVLNVLTYEKWAPAKPCAGLLKTISFSNPQARHTPGAWSGCLSNKFLSHSLKFLGKYKQQSQINAF